jgi:16S rRNA (cytosine967-C5)-methyltransferase
MHESQRYAAIIIDKILGGTNLDTAFENVFRNVKGLEHKSQTKAITYGALRHMGQSKYLIKSLVRKKIENRLVESLIHVALFQLSHESHNDFTIVDQAVEAAKKIDLRKSNFVNAVLRNFLRNKDTLTKEFLEQEEGQFNYPIWWIQKVKKQYKSNWKNILNIGNGHPPMTIRVNKRKIIMKEYKELLKENEISFIALANEGLILKDAKNIKDIPGFENGLFSVQDFGAQLASVLLDLKNDYLVLDACAAPGGKTTSMLENSNINLIALEKNTQRARKIIENLKRLKLEATVITQPLDNRNKWWNKKQFDRILLDVPCSASGIVRRHVDMKWLRRLSDLEKFADMQLDLLNNAWPLLKPQGKLLYVTCSIFKEENEEVILKFCDNRQNVKRGKLKFPKNIQHVKNQLIPSKDHDGLYYEILEKK